MRVARTSPPRKFFFLVSKPIKRSIQQTVMSFGPPSRRWLPKQKQPQPQPQPPQRRVGGHHTRVAGTAAVAVETSSGASARHGIDAPYSPPSRLRLQPSNDAKRGGSTRSVNTSTAQARRSSYGNAKQQRRAVSDRALRPSAGAGAAAGAGAGVSNRQQREGGVFRQASSRRHRSAGQARDGASVARRRGPHHGTSAAPPITTTTATAAAKHGPSREARKRSEAKQQRAAQQAAREAIAAAVAAVDEPEEGPPANEARQASPTSSPPPRPPSTVQEYYDDSAGYMR